MALLLSQRFDLPSIVGELLAERGVDVEDVERFLTPKISELLSDPFQLTDMVSAVERLKRAIKKIVDSPESRIQVMNRLVGSTKEI